METAVTFGSVCTGIGGFDFGFERAGMKCLWTVEIDDRCNEVLDKHFPNAKRYRDMLSVREQLEPVDVLCGGTPCQGFSIAGLRGGLADERSNLALEFIRIADRINPRIIVWENVPGVLSDSENAFGCFLAALVGCDSPLVPTKECGGRWTNSGMVVGPKRSAAWRILDSQYFGLAQRRERVFLVADIGEGRAAKILFEPESLRRNFAPRRTQGKDIASCLGGGSASGGFGSDTDRCGAFIPEVANTLRKEHDGGIRPDFDTCVVSPTLDANHKRKFGSHQWVNNGFAILTHDPDPCLQERDSKGQDSNCDKAMVIESIGFNGAQYPIHCPELTGSLETNPAAMCVAFQQNQSGDVYQSDIPGALSTNQNATGRGTAKILSQYKVRRLTPNECAILSGFPPSWNDWLKDSPRYAQFGNCCNVPVCEWIGRRIVSALKV